MRTREEQDTRVLGLPVAVDLDEALEIYEREGLRFADIMMTADPVAYLLIGFGRQPIWRAALSGRVVASGRKPWDRLTLPKLFVNP